MTQTSNAALLTAILQRDALKVLTLTQPWATLVAVGAKHMETRSWGTDYQGPLAIHAAKSYSSECEALCEDEPFHHVLEDAGYDWQPDRLRNRRGLPTGEIIAVVWLEQVERITPHFPVTPTERAFGNYASGRFAWVFSQVYRLRTPIPARGTLGLWTWQPTPAFWHEVQQAHDTCRTPRVALPGRRQDNTRPQSVLTHAWRLTDDPGA